MRRHAVIGWTPEGPEGVAVRISTLAHAQRLLGRLDLLRPDQPSPALVAAANLFMGRASEVTVVRVAGDALPSPDALASALSRGPAPDTVALLLPATRDGLMALADALGSAPWSGPGLEGAVGPILFCIPPSDDPDACASLPEGIVPVPTEVSTIAPGRPGPWRLCGASLIQAAWDAAPGPAPGAHDLISTPDPHLRRRWLEAGAAVLDQASGARRALVAAMPTALQPRPALATSFEGSDPLEAKLRAILDEEHAEAGRGWEGRVHRRWVAALEEARRHGALAGATSDEAYRVVIVGPGQFEVFLRRPNRAPTGLSLKMTPFQR